MLMEGTMNIFIEEKMDLLVVKIITYVHIYNRKIIHTKHKIYIIVDVDVRCRCRKSERVSENQY